MTVKQTDRFFPRATATNAFDLIYHDLPAAILGEPRRYNQEVWRDFPREIREAFGYDGEPLTSFPKSKGFAACGTAACEAGWIVGLVKGPAMLRDKQFYVPDLAASILGQSIPDV